MGIHVVAKGRTVVFYINFNQPNIGHSDSPIIMCTCVSC
jgi:hypothetical protein